MTALYVEHFNKIKADLKSNNIIVYFFIFVAIVCFTGVLWLLIIRSQQPVLGISLFVLGITNLKVAANNKLVISYSKRENEIRQMKDQMKNILDCINMFYIPLKVLLICEQDVKNETYKRKLVQIRNNSYLADKKVRLAFEKYMQGNYYGESEKLLELVYLEIEHLRRQYVEIKRELKEE